MPSLHNNVSLRGKTKFKNYDDNDCTAKYVNIDKTRLIGEFYVVCT